MTPALTGASPTGATKARAVSPGKNDCLPVAATSRMRGTEEHEGAAPEARALRFDEIQQELHGDCRIDRRTALPEDEIPDIDRQRIRGSDHEVARDDRRLVDPGRGGFRQRRRRFLRANCDGAMDDECAERKGGKEAAKGHRQRYPKRKSLADAQMERFRRAAQGRRRSS